MGILRTDRITGLGGANAIKGSVKFTGDASSGTTKGVSLNITGSDKDDLNFAGNDFTFEAWVFPTANIAFNPVYCQAWGLQIYIDTTSDDNNVKIYVASSDTSSYAIGGATSANGTIKPDAWNHVAFSRSGNSWTIFTNGTAATSSTSSQSLVSSNADYTIGIFNSIGSGNDLGSYFGFNGYISNLRIRTGAHYLPSTNFTPPVGELQKTSDTVLLCCQSSADSTKEETGKTLVPTRKNTNDKLPTASKFTPNSPVGFSTTTDVGSQYGSTFDGFGNFATSTYMVPPGGNTRERNRGRGLIGQGSNTSSPSNVKAISFIEIQSGGTAFDFGDSTNGSMYAMTAVSSSTRAVFAGGHTSQSSPYGNTNLMEFVTISTTANCIDFGDLDVAAANRVGASNQTRGLIAAGYSPNTRQIDKIEIATAGDATDYGDLDNQGFYGLNSGGMVSSSTRGLYAGGSGNSAPTAINTITFSLFSTSGNSTDFGDLTHTNGYFNVGNSNGTRGIFMGGGDWDSPYPATDQVDYVTIASAGNAIDFGSLNTARYNAMGASNLTRGVIAGGRINPAPSLPATNHIEYITISSAGNGLNFGELIEQERSGAGCSDSHGGLS